MLVTDIKEVMNILKSGSVVVKIGKNIIINGKDIFKQVESLVIDAESNNWQGIGTELGDIIRELLLNLMQDQKYQFLYFN